jgi:hypothetical protein
MVVTANSFPTDGAAATRPLAVGPRTSTLIVELGYFLIRTRDDCG